MENQIIIYCKLCGTEVRSHPTQMKCCGCQNFTCIRGTNISAQNMDQVQLIQSLTKSKKTNIISNEDLAWTTSRTSRKVRKIDFEEK